MIPLVLLLCSYAYGLVLWCLFSGRKAPFADAAGNLTISAVPVDVCRHVMGGGRPDIRALRPGTPVVVAALIQRCWARDPAARPTAREIANETSRWLQDKVRLY